MVSSQAECLFFPVPNCPDRSWIGYISGQAYQEGRDHRQVRHPVRCFPEEDRQEDGGLSALQVHLQLLRKGGHEEEGCRYLEVSFMNSNFRLHS